MALMGNCTSREEGPGELQRQFDECPRGPRLEQVRALFVIDRWSAGAVTEVPTFGTRFAPPQPVSLF